MNTDGRVFSIAKGNSAWNVTRVYVEARKCLRVQNAQNLGSTTYNGLSGRWINIGAYPGGGVYLKKYNC